MEAPTLRERKQGRKKLTAKEKKLKAQQFKDKTEGVTFYNGETPYHYENGKLTEGEA